MIPPVHVREISADDHLKESASVIQCLWGRNASAITYNYCEVNLSVAIYARDKYQLMRM